MEGLAGGSYSICPSGGSKYLSPNGLSDGGWNSGLGPIGAELQPTAIRLIIARATVERIISIHRARIFPDCMFYSLVMIDKLAERN